MGQAKRGSKFLGLYPLQWAMIILHAFLLADLLLWVNIFSLLCMHCELQCQACFCLACHLCSRSRLLSNLCTRSESAATTNVQENIKPHVSCGFAGYVFANHASRWAPRCVCIQNCRTCNFKNPILMCKHLRHLPVHMPTCLPRICGMSTSSGCVER